MSPTVLVVQHQDDCPPALVGAWLEELGVQLDVRRGDLGDEVPERLEADGLVVLGGSMGATEDARAPWLPATRALVRDAAERGLPVLGICLGHQIAAVALGGEVGLNPRGQTCGAVAITRTTDDDPLAAALPTRGVVTQWNHDAVLVPPPGTTVLATNAHDDLLLARFAGSVWGVQGHPEATVDVVGSWAARSGDDPRPQALSVDEHPAILAELAERAPELASVWRPVITAWAALLR